MRERSDVNTEIKRECVLFKCVCVCIVCAVCVCESEKEKEWERGNERDQRMLNKTPALNWCNRRR